MSLPYPFPFWVFIEEKGNKVGRLLYRWPTLTWQNKISTQDLVSDIVFFVLKGDVNLPTNQPTDWNIEH